MKKHLLLLALTCLAACTEKKETVVVENAPAKINESIESAKIDDQFVLNIKKSSLGKNFLLLASIKSSALAAQWNDLKPALVYFEKSGRTLVMYQYKDGFYEDIKHEAMLSSFPIIKETADEITFSWEVGVKSIPTTDIFGDPTDTSNDDRAFQGLESGMKIRESVTKTARIENNEMIIEQLLRIETTQISNKQSKQNRKIIKNQQLVTLESSVVAHMVIRPYVANKNFKVIDRDDSETVGFFNNSVLDRESGKMTQKIDHWDLDPSRGPVTYVLSSQVPEQYKQTLTEAILYWNKVVGREAFAVAYNGDADAFPQDRTVLVRWVPWTTAGFAYANFQADPLTGEILRGQVFMTSSFVDITRKTLNGDANKAAQNLSLTISGLQSASVPCEVANAGFAAANRSNADAVIKMPKDIQEKAIQDTLRTVLAHEVGHTLGLRHNFAASFSIKATKQDQDDGYKKYLAEIAYPGMMTATSVMDYIAGADQYMLGRFIQQNALPYDVMALNYAYSNQKSLNSAVSLYCSDEHSDKPQSEEGLEVYGCKRFDSGSSPSLNQMSQSESETADYIIRNTFSKQLAALFPPAGEAALSMDQLVEKMKANPILFYVYFANSKLEQTLGWLKLRTEEGTTTPHTVLITIDQAKAGLKNRYYSDSYQDSSVTTALKKQINDQGGLDAILAKDLYIDPKTGLIDSARIGELIENTYVDSLRKGKTTQGTEYEISPADFKKLKEATKTLAEFCRNNGMNGAFDFLVSHQEKTDSTSSGDGGTSKYSVDYVSGVIEGQWVDKTLGLLIKIAEASNTTKTLVDGERSLNVAIPFYQRYLISNFIKFFNESQWNTAGTKATALKAELTLGRLKWLQGIAVFYDATAINQKDPDELFNIIGKAYVEKKFDVTVYQAAYSEVGLIKALNTVTATK